MGGAGAGAGTGAGAGPVWPRVRRLPTHVVIFDTDAERPGVAAWLAASKFSLPRGRSFPFSALPGPLQLRGDAHAAPGGEPREVRVYSHACWVDAVAAAGPTT